MNPALQTAATGMATQQTRTEVIANNLANVNTTAFKRSRAQFQDLLYQNIKGTALGSDNATGAVQIGRGVKLAAIQRLHTQGALEATGGTLDVAIDGDGFFPVTLANGNTAYTRDGSFQISDQGVLVTADGLQVGGGIKIPSTISQITISPTGNVTGSTGAGGEATDLGRIDLARFANPSGLESLGQNLLAASTTSGEAQTGFPQDEGFGRTIQGNLEGSNVEIVQEMVDMISAQRAYELNSKAVQTAEAMSQVASDMIR